MKRKNRSTLDSKGQMEAGAITVSIVILLFSMIAMLSFVVLKDINSFTQNETDFSNLSKSTLQDLETRFPSTFDGLFMLMLGLLLLLMSIAGYFAGTHPLYLIVTIVLFLGIGLVAMIFSNIWEEFTDEPSITFENDFPIMNFVLDNYLIVIMGAISLITLAIFMGSKS